MNPPTSNATPMSDRIKQAAKGAGRYQSFEEFLTQVVLAERKMYGWVDNEFYELWPGGRCIRWTKFV